LRERERERERDRERRGGGEEERIKKVYDICYGSFLQIVSQNRPDKLNNH